MVDALDFRRPSREKVSHAGEITMKRHWPSKNIRVTRGKVALHVTSRSNRILFDRHAIGRFLDWCSRAGLQSLEDIEPITVAAYIEQHPGSPPTVKQHMAAIRMLFSWLTEKGVLAMNPAREVKTE